MNWQMHIIVRVPVEVWLNVSRRQASNGGMIDLMIDVLLQGYDSVYGERCIGLCTPVPVGKAYVL